MAYGRRCEEWDQTSLLAALAHNASLGATTPMHPDDFHPLRPGGRRPDAGDRVTISIEDFAVITGGTLEVIR